MRRWFSQTLSATLGWCLSIVVAICLILGLRHGAVRRRQLAVSQRIADKSKEKIIEIQQAQLGASARVRGGRDRLAERLRGGRF